MLGTVLLILVFIGLIILALYIGFRRGVEGSYAKIDNPVSIGDLTKARLLIEYLDTDINKKMTFDTHKDLYLDIHSGHQIQQILKLGGPIDQARLIQIFLKYLTDISDFPRKLFIINNLLTKYPGDRAIYSELCKYMSKESFQHSVDRNEKYAAKIYKVLRHNNINKIDNALDIGCGSGKLTKYLKSALQIKDMHCVEIYKDPKRETDITFDDIDPGDFSWKLPYKDKTFDMVFSLMTLHHVEDKLENMIAEIARVLNPEGYLFIKEHDTWTAFDAMIVDINHAIYMACKENINERMENYHIRHMNYYGWVDILSKYFEPVVWDYFYLDIKQNLNPTRNFWALFRLK